MRYLVYIIRCKDGSLYTGITNNLDKRIQDHNAGRAAAYTRGRGPVKCLYTEPHADRSSALRREAAIKKLSRPEKLQLIGAGNV